VNGDAEGGGESGAVPEQASTEEIRKENREGAEDRLSVQHLVIGPAAEPVESRQPSRIEWYPARPTERLPRQKFPRQVVVSGLVGGQSPGGIGPLRVDAPRGVQPKTKAEQHNQQDGGCLPAGDAGAVRIRHTAEPCKGPTEAGSADRQVAEGPAGAQRETRSAAPFPCRRESPRPSGGNRSRNARHRNAATLTAGPAPH
jgi:hypothetical protein